MSYSQVKSVNFSEGETLTWFPFIFLVLTFWVLHFPGLLLFFGIACSSSSFIENNEGFGYLVVGSLSLKRFEYTYVNFPGWKVSLPLLIIATHSLFSLFVFRKTLPFHCHFMTIFLFCLGNAYHCCIGQCSSDCSFPIFFVWKLKRTKIFIINYKNSQLNQYQAIYCCNNLQLKWLKWLMFTQMSILQCLHLRGKNYSQHLSVFMVR